MAVKCEFIDFIIPISNIDKVYEGGFKKFKSDNIGYFGKRFWNDEFLFRDGAMSPIDMKLIAKEWEDLGLKGVIEVNGEKKWKDFCVFEMLSGGATLPCDWIEFDEESRSVYYKGKPKGVAVGPDRFKDEDKEIDDENN